MYGKIPYMKKEKQAAKTMNARMELRLDPDDKALIERAAALLGVKPASFTRSALVNQANEVIRQAHMVAFDEKATRDCLAALSKPFAPNEALSRALERGSKLGL
jgi:uncharacterized protein (DUF1778 family)